MTDINQKIENGMKTAFIDYTQLSGQSYRPKFIYNDYKKGKKVVSSIEEELGALNKDDTFFISVAFITDSGLALLLQSLKELEERGVNGKILTTDYLTFSSPTALKKLAEFSNLEVRMYKVGDGPGFHTKGYIFNKDGLYRIIVGSSNITGAALTRNAEWNTRVISTLDGEFAREMLIEFQFYWDQADEIGDWIEAYAKAFEEQRRIASQESVIDYAQAVLKPNDMQLEFIVNLNKLLKAGERRALLISATGTGKTYASAFALRDSEAVDFKRILFVVHREQIADQALRSYQRVFGSTRSYGKISGNQRDYGADIIFATVQTLYKDDVLNRFKIDAFDAIVLDEVHRAGAQMHQKVISYFQPKLYLGMTASPERTDGYDIFDLFDHNIACEIRLQQAMEEDYLCPFHYFGISDFEIDGKVIDDKTEFSYLTLDRRVDHIVEKIQYYGYSGDRVKGLIFCRTNEESKTLSEKFNTRGYRTVDLSGEDNQLVRAEAINRLVGDDTGSALDYIFTVDIFNEGVDIPEINQVVMLRPTKSPIVFVQQLGRGLRKHKDKDYVMVLDFIGNYDNNFMIPIALSGDRSYNPDTIRRYVREGSRIIPGESSIHFDKISRQRIYEKISTLKNPQMKILKENYFNLKHKLGHIPSITDFYTLGEIDPMLFIAKEKTYDRFVRKVDDNYNVEFNRDESDVLEYISSYILNSKRIYEPVMLQMLINNEKLSSNSVEFEIEKCGEKYNYYSFLSAIRILDKSFIVANEVSKFCGVEIIDSLGTEEWVVSQKLENLLENPNFKKEIEELLEFTMLKYMNEYEEHDADGFVLYKKYSRQDACRILNWEKDEKGTIFGYKIKYNTCPIFVTYDKSQEVSKTTDYPDELIDESTFSWLTRSKVRIDSPEPQKINSYKETGLKIHLFIKKDDDEGSDFYYMGRVEPQACKPTTIKNDKGEELPIVNFIFRMENEVRSDMYEYFTEEDLLQEA